MSDAPRRQARGERRRDEVLEAALRVLAREGPRGVTHRAVALEAGTSLRATTYYFASRDDLLAQAFELYAARAIARFSAMQELLASTPLSAETAADALAAIVVGDVVDDRAGLVAEYELALEAARTPSVAPLYRRWERALDAMLVEHARALGSTTPSLHARLVLATLRGLEIEALARSDEPLDAASLREAFVTLLRALVAGAGGVNAPAPRAPSRAPHDAPRSTRARGRSHR